MPRPRRSRGDRRRAIARPARLGLIEALARIHVPISALVGVDQGGAGRYRLPYPALRRVMGNRHFNFMRGDLERVLYEQVEGRVAVRFAAEVTAFVEHAEGLEVVLSDGSREGCDLLVGADGIHSRVRERLFGPERVFSRYMGMRTAAFVLDAVPKALQGADTFPMLTLVDRMVAAYPFGGDRLATFFLYAAPEPLAERPVAEPCEALAQVFGDLGWVVPQLLAGCGQSGPPYYDDVAQIALPSWHKGRVALLGDACQAVSLVAGQGASLAMAGA